MIIRYDCANAPSPRGVRIFLAGKGVPRVAVQTGLRDGT